ncbi:Ubiquinone biosynthesis protein OS=Streptomyces griseomycini OX=66895 GN=FHS37_005983 PE=4 SV=1 [Streptomyces griseomycini]
MLFCTGLVHCDLHPGNLRLTRTGSVVVLDAGFVYRVPEVVRENLALFFLNLGFRNGPRCAEAVLASAEQVDRHSDTAAFTADMTRLVDRYGGTTARDFDLIAFSTELFASQRRNGIYASSEFVFPLLALLMVEQTVRRLDPDVDFQAIARPIVFRAASGRPAGERRRRLETAG